MTRTLCALAVALWLMPTPAAAFVKVHKIGYIGCSNTRDSVRGYHSLPTKHRFWPMYDTGNGSIDKWADPASSFWALFDAETVTYGLPSVVWVQLCENFPAHPMTYDDVLAMLANLTQRVPNALIYVSGINAYDPVAGLCALMGPNGEGETDTYAWRDRSVNDNRALLGPTMGPLNASNTISDGCHVNFVGGQLLGNQLAVFFDAL